MSTFLRTLESEADTLERGAEILTNYLKKPGLGQSPAEAAIEQAIVLLLRKEAARTRLKLSQRRQTTKALAAVFSDATAGAARGANA